MPDYAALADKKNELIRKALDGSAFIAPITADPLTAMTGPDSMLLELPDGYEDAGWLSSDGIAFGRDVSSSDVSSFGSQSPTRSDTTADTTTVTIVGQESKRLTIETYLGVDLSALVPEAGGGVMVAKPGRPKARFHRLFAVAVDDGDAGEIYIGRELPRAKPTAYTEQAFSSGDDPITWGVTFTGYKDSALGTAERYHFGGPGWAALLDSMGFLPAAS